MLTTPGRRAIYLAQPSIWTPMQLSPALWLDASYGVYTDGAAQFTAASLQYLTRSGMGLGDTDWWMAGWLYRDTGGWGFALTKDNALGVGPNYAVYTQAGTYLFFDIKDAAGAGVSVSWTAPLPTGVWKFFMIYHDAVNDQTAISVDAGAFATAATAGLVPNSGSSAPFNLAARNDETGFGLWNGRMDSVMIGNAPVGGIAALATTIRDSLYNGGNGRTYADLSAAQKTAWGLVSAWDLDEITGTRYDSHGTNHLTASASSPTTANGIAAGLCTDGDPVKLWTDRSIYGNHATQATAAKKPTWKSGILNGWPVVRGDAVATYLEKSGMTLAQPCTVWVVATNPTDGGYYHSSVSASAARALSRVDATTARMAAGSNFDSTVTTQASFRSAISVYNGASSALWWDGAKTSGDAGSTDGTGLRLLASGGGSPSGYSGGDIAELGAISGAISDPDAGRLYSYLKRRYALS